MVRCDSGRAHCNVAAFSSVTKAQHLIRDKLGKKKKIHLVK